MAIKGIVHIFRIALLNDDICNLVPSRMPCPNTELRKKCKIQEYGGYTGTDEGGTISSSG